MNELRPLLPSDCTEQVCHQFSMLYCTVSPFWRRMSTLSRSGRFSGQVETEPQEGMIRELQDGSRGDTWQLLSLWAQIRVSGWLCRKGCEQRAHALTSQTLSTRALARGNKCFNRAEGTQDSLPSSDPEWKEAQKTSHPLALPLGQPWLLLAYTYHKTKATNI